MRAHRRAARFLLAVFAALSPGAACTIVSPVLPAGPSFQVRVEDQGRPVKGLRIKLKGDHRTQAVTTSEHGTAHFQNIPPGTYQIGAEVAEGIPSGATINVTANGPKHATIPLEWPNQRPLPVQTLKGILRWPSVQPDQQLLVLQVELLDARTGRMQKRTQTTRDGAFDLGTPAPGLHFLRVTPTGLAPQGGTRETGIIPVELDQQAEQLDLDLELGSTSCGFQYVARHTCPQQELSMTSLRGQVYDLSGASIPRATISLFNKDRKIAEQLTTDEQGRFLSTKQFEGHYELVVGHMGFTSLRQSMQARRQSSEEPPATLRIQLGVTGTCSHAALR